MSALDDARAVLALVDEAPYPVPLTPAAAALAALVAECESYIAPDPETLRGLLEQAFVCGDEGPWSDVRAAAREYAEEALEHLAPREAP